MRWSLVNFQCRVSYNLAVNRARAYCACSRCGWGLFGYLFSSIFSLLFLPLSGRQSDILSQRAVKPKTTNQFRCMGITIFCDFFSFLNEEPFQKGSVLKKKKERICTCAPNEANSSL